ncbi:MAG: hypothetical protein A3K19_23155 [Lentisphaerae bacterium RIFOXYB12_FULL_65_16]|nr:MAG: hypothetical protein A3K18_15665 [Lentisphaerae bacterium RIFOXYA12_64_32]OGV84943.1 MAG: hypothetical protein A3K19_23155 [Lentisphaerae bacterium RIFOXYB12_FULL_65_16]
MGPSLFDDTMEISFWGTRGSISTPGRTTEKYGGNTPCVSVRSANTFIILDAGTGIRNFGHELVQKYRNNFNEASLNLFLSHTHWDHIQGLPFFDPLYIPGVHLSVYGSPGKRGLLEQILRGQMDMDYFPVQMSALSAELIIREMDKELIEIIPFRIDWQEQIYHPGGSVRFGINLGKKRLVYATDVELNKCFVENPTPEQKGHQRAYMKFIEGADMLIADGQYTAEEYVKTKNYGHTTIPLLADIAYRCRVKQLAVFHHNPPHTDNNIDELWQDYHARFMTADPPMNVFWAREGQAIPL